MSLDRRLVPGVALLLALAAASWSPTANAAQRVEVVDAPSVAGNVDLRVARTNRISRLQARVLLPDGYDEQPGRRWPVLYLLHGVGDDSGTWLDRRYGDLQARARGLPAIVVSAEGGRGYYTDAWLGGSRTGVNWERYFLDELVPLIERRYRISLGREHHAIGGLSMGGYGAMLLGSQLPGYFGTVLSFSGLYDIESPEATSWVPLFSRFSYTRQWGRFRGPYAQAHNPARLLSNLRATRQYISAGNGVPTPDVAGSLRAVVLGGTTEWLALIDAERFARRARAMDIDITFSSHTAGVHYWSSWRRELEAAIRWGLFRTSAATPVDAARHFTYRTMAPHGNAWGLGFRFSTLPTDQMILRRDGQRLSATGSGAVTISPGAAAHDATGAGTRSGCTFTATLPFERELPAGC